MTYRLGVDVGGTFTDLLLFDEDNRRFLAAQDAFDARMTVRTASSAALTAICAKGRDYPCRDRDSSCTARPSPPTPCSRARARGSGLVVTDGYRQIMQIARSFVPGGLAGWIVWPKPEPLAALEDTVEIAGRMDAQGQRNRARSTRRRSAPRSRRSRRQDIEALTVSLMNGYLNGAHELRVGRTRRRDHARHAGLAQPRGPARNAGIRAHADHRRQRRRAPGGRAAMSAICAQRCAMAAWPDRCRCCAPTAG